MIRVSFLVPPRHSLRTWPAVKYECLDYSPSHLCYEAQLQYDVSSDDESFTKKKTLWLENWVRGTAWFYDSMNSLCMKAEELVREYWSLPDGRMFAQDVQWLGGPGDAGDVVCDKRCRQFGVVNGKLRVVYLKPRGGADDEDYLLGLPDDQHYSGQDGAHDEYEHGATQPTIRDVMDGMGSESHHVEPPNGWADTQYDPELLSAFGTADYRYEYELYHCAKAGRGTPAAPRGGGPQSPGGEQPGGPRTGGAKPRGPSTPETVPAEPELSRQRWPGEFRRNGGSWERIDTLVQVRIPGTVYASTNSRWNWRPLAPEDLMHPRDAPDSSTIDMRVKGSVRR